MQSETDALPDFVIEQLSEQNMGTLWEIANYVDPDPDVPDFAAEAPLLQDEETLEAMAKYARRLAREQEAELREKLDDLTIDIEEPPIEA